MPSFDFTSPEGKNYTVEGPPGATKEQAFAILQQRLAPPKLGPKDIPDSAPAQEKPAQPVKEDSILADKVKGVLGAGLSMGAGAVGQAVGTVAGIGESVASGTYGTQEGAQQAQERAGKVTQGFQSLVPTNDKAREYLEMVGRAVEISKIQGLGPSEALALASTPARPALTQAGKALAPEAEALKRAGGKVADIVTPKPSPEIGALAAKAEALGIELRPDMLADNRIAKFLGEALEQVPMSGSKAEQRQMAFNGALAKIIGSEGKVQRLTPDVFDRAMTSSGEKIGQISKETPITIDSDLRAQFNARVQEASKFETADVARIVSNYVQEMDGLTVNGVMPGEAFRKLNSKIGRQIRGTQNGDLKNALYELQQDMHDALEKNIRSPERLAELKDARLKYAMGKIIEPLVAKAKGGDISPAGLMGAVTSDSSKKTMMARGQAGEIGDLARIGQAFLKEPPSSGTGERLGAYSLLSGHGLALAPAIPLANAYNRIGPELAKRAIKRRTADPLEFKPWNEATKNIVDTLSE